MPLLERALAALGPTDSPLRVRLLARLAGGPLRDGRFPPERKAVLSEEALAMARRLDDPSTLAYAIQGYIVAHHAPAHTIRQLELATELLAIAEQLGDKERAVDAHEQRLNSLLELGAIGEAKLELESMTRLASELKQPSQEWLASVYRAQLALLQGGPEEAEAMILQARTVGEAVHGWNAEVTYRLQLYLLRHRQRAVGDVEALVRSSLEQYPTYAIWRCVHVHMAAELGHDAEARAALDAVARDGFAAIPVDEEWLVGMCLLAEAAAALRASAHAAELYDALLPYADRVAVSYPELSSGAVARYLGLLAAAMERWPDAERHLADALELNRRIEAWPWLERTEQDRARMLLARDAV